MKVLKWLFIDFDSYFASVEQHHRPELRGRPVGVIPTQAETTSCIAASYEAKAYGVRTGTRVAEARRLCPHIQFVCSSHRLYIHYHHLFHRAIEDVIPIAQTHSIDEVSCRLALDCRTPDAIHALMHRIRHHLGQHVSPWITCSMGAAPNPFLAKLASKYNKPDGAHVVQADQILTFLHQHTLSDLHGVGRNMEKRLRKHGIYTVRQLTQCSEHTLRQIWGSVHGSRMWHALQGHDLPDRSTHTSSMGHSNMLAPEHRPPMRAHQLLHRLLQKAILRLRSKGYVTSALQLSLRYENNTRWGLEARFDDTAQSHHLRHALNTLWEQRPTPTASLRKVSITLLRLRALNNYTPTLFSTPDLKREALDNTVDDLVQRFGIHSAYYASAHDAQSAVPIRIAFHHIPEDAE